MKILFVENHQVFAKIVVTQFLSHYEVTQVPTVTRAISLLQQNSYDLLLVDYDLDDGKGDQVVHMAKQLVPKPRIIGISSHERGNSNLRDAGADATCSKMHFAEIGSVISNLFDS